MVLLGTADRLPAQDVGKHFLQSRDLSPGAIGRERLKRDGPVHGYIQPVEIHAPPGALVSVAVDGSFSKPQKAPLVAGMLISPLYRLRVTNIPIPFKEGTEVYPTIEVIDRTYPPRGQRLRFPIVVDLSLEDLHLASQGSLVERYIYIEDSDSASPVADDPKEQSWFEIREGENPLEVADQLGRPVAIVRMGARVPSLDGPDASFLYGSPPVTLYPASAIPRAPQALPPLPKPAMKPKAPAPAPMPGEGARFLPQRPLLPLFRNRFSTDPPNDLRPVHTTQPVNDRRLR